MKHPYIAAGIDQQGRMHSGRHMQPPRYGDEADPPMGLDDALLLAALVISAWVAICALYMAFTSLLTAAIAS
jgi:hypothetical protein